MQPFYIGMAGFGTVGGGLCQLLQDNADIIAARTGRQIILRKILVRDAAKQRAVAPPPGAAITTSMDELVNDPEIEAVVELMGGIDAARKLIRASLLQNKHVVTANKALLAEDSLELFEIAEKARRIITPTPSCR